MNITCQYLHSLSTGRLYKWEKFRKVLKIEFVLHRNSPQTCWKMSFIHYALCNEQESGCPYLILPRARVLEKSHDSCGDFLIHVQPNHDPNLKDHILSAIIPQRLLCPAKTLRDPHLQNITVSTFVGVRCQTSQSSNGKFSNLSQCPGILSKIITSRNL